MNEKINAWILNEKEKSEKRIVLNNIAEEISKKFKIEKSKAIYLIKSETLEWIDSLKKELKIENLNNKQLEELFLILKWAKELVENLSKIEIKILKEDIEKKLEIYEDKNILEKKLPKKLIEKAKNPNHIHEHILWISLWTANSIISIIDALYQIWAWIIKTPYHLYLVISWKWEFKSWKNI